MEAALTDLRDSRQRYLPNTAILETILESATGSMRAVDFARASAAMAACSVRRCCCDGSNPWPAVRA